MQKNQESSYFSNEHDKQSVQINHLTFEKPDYQKIKRTPFWTINHCFDILAHLKDASQVYETLISAKKVFFKRNAKDNVKSIINSAPSFKKEPVIKGPLEKIQNDIKDQKLKNELLGMPFSKRGITLNKDGDWDEVYKERKRILKKFNKEQTQINPAIRHLDKCLRDIKDLFKSKDFIDVESEYTMGKCQPFKFLKWAKANGYKIPFNIEIIEDGGGKIQWRDSIAFGNLEQTFPKHPTGKKLEDDPLYVAVKVRESFMNTEIKISEFKPIKQQLAAYVGKKYSHISEVKRKEIISLVNDGFRHGGNRKK